MASRDLVLCMAPPWGRRAPPLGLAYLSTYLNQVGGIPTAVHDLNIALFSRIKDRADLDIWDERAGIGTKRYWELLAREVPHELASARAALLEHDPKVIGFSINYHNFAVTDGLIRSLRAERPDITYVVGGAQTYYMDQLGHLGREHCAADYAVIGEGEIPLLELARRAIAHEPVEGIPGVVPIGAPRNACGTTAKLHMQLDAIPFPTFEEFDLSLYDPGEGHVLHLPMVFTRGCPQTCTFCTDIMIAGGYRNRSPERTVAEMRHHVETYGIRYFHFLDLQFNSNHKLLRELCERIIDAKLDVHWTSYGTMHRLLDPSLFRLLKASGCPTMHYGFEHASARVLKAMNKRYDAALASRNITEAHAEGLGVAINVIVGYPGETEEDVAVLEAFIREHAHALTQVTNLGTAILQPGSDLDVHSHQYAIHKLDLVRRTWCDHAGTNTYRVRRARALRIHALLDSLGIPVIKLNLEDDLPVQLAAFGIVVDPAQAEALRDLEERVVAGERGLREDLRLRAIDLTHQITYVAKLEADLRALSAQVVALGTRGAELEERERLLLAEKTREGEAHEREIAAQAAEIRRLAEIIARGEERERLLAGQLAWARSWKGWLCEAPFVPRWLVQWWSRWRGGGSREVGP